MCNKNGAAAKMVADSNGDCQCPAFITDITGDAAAKEGEECTGSLQSSSGGMKSLKSASMTSSICSGMVCQLESEEGGDIVLMVADDEGACSCPGREDKNARQQAKLCGKGLTCAAADKPWGYCCEGKGVCRQAEGCTSSKNQCLAACPGVKRPGIAIEFSRTCMLESWFETSLEDGDCKTDEDCGAHSKCIIAPSTGHEVVGGIGKCFNKPGEATDGPGMCTDLCDLMACPGDCKMGIRGTWKIEKTMPKAASKRCNRGAGEIGVMKGSDYSCEKSAAEAMMLTYEGISMEDLAAGPELLFRIQVRDNLIKSNEGKLKLSDIVEVLLKDRQIGRRRAGEGIEATIAFSSETNVNSLSYEDGSGIDLDDGTVLQQVGALETVQTDESFTANPTSEPTLAPTQPPAATSGSETTGSPTATSEEFPTVESAASATVVSVTTLLVLSAPWW
jgi:hypothetical protein